ncbi:hypothetical protein GCM10023165_44430 [Variovorax defluvii]|uniref:Isochorismatase-like domain-containing protein n=1 Tax=Variovorax defluvii TaxID=913761 RepID=A0ABP8I9E8_9BURK
MIDRSLALSGPPLASATTAMLVVDMQKDRVDIGAPLFDPLAHEAIVPTRRMLELARATDVRVVFIAHAHRGDGSDRGRRADHRSAGRERPAPVEGTSGARICDALHPLPHEPLICKRRESAFFGTDLDTVLRSMRIETVVFTGSPASRALLPSVHDALARDYRTLFVHDPRTGTAPGTGDAIDTVLAAMAMTSAEVMSVDGFANLIMRERL